MKTNTITQARNENLSTLCPTSRLQQTPPVRTRCRRIRIALAPRRESCLTRRALLAALREAELADWLASGGDYLSSMHQPID